MTPDCGPTDVPQDVDIDALRERYRAERDKATAPGRSAQYLELTGNLADFYEIDPYTTVVERDPIREDADVVILGGGFAGLLAGAYLKKAGVDGVRVIEMAGDFGGVWYWNRFRASSATTTPIATSRCWKNSASCRRRNTPTARRSSSTAATSENTSASTTARCSPPGCANCAGTTRCIAGGSAPTAATTSGPASW